MNISADELIGAFTDISYAYRLAGANHDAIVATLTDPDSETLLAQAFHFPLGVGAPRPTTTLSAVVERVGDGCCSLRVRADELAVAVAIEATGWRPSDNYFHIAPNSERVILLTASGGRARLSGHVAALNTSAPLAFHAP